jgi:hypothetical protein
MNYRNPKYNAFGSIDCDIDHPVYGWIPFTASPDDVEQNGKLLFAEIMAAGKIAEYVPPPAYIPTEADVRQERDRLLAASDWTQLPDAQAALSNAQKLAWSAYRQALRDVPQQLNFPSNVTWPVKPT